MAKLTLSLEVEFSKGAQITPDDRARIMRNIVESVSDAAGTSGIVPDDADYITNKVRLTDYANNAVSVDLSHGVPKFQSTF